LYLSFISRLAKILYMLWLSQVFENINIADLLGVYAILEVMQPPYLRLRFSHPYQ